MTSWRAVIGAHTSAAAIHCSSTQLHGDWWSAESSPAASRRRRDWRALIQYGVIFFLLEKLGAVVGTTNLHIYAAMRGQSLEDFQKTRNAQVLYSVAGQDEGKKDWDKS